MKKLLIAATLLITLNANNLYYKYEECYKKGDYKCALKYSIKQLDEDLKIYPKNSKQIATDYNNIGILAIKLEDYEAGLHYLQKALDIDKKVLGETHPDNKLLLKPFGL